MLEANPSNDIVAAVRDAASFLAGPFAGLFTRPRQQQVPERAVNWGLAAVVWFALGRLIGAPAAASLTGTGSAG